MSDFIQSKSSSYFIADREIRGVAFNFEGTCVDVEAAHWAGHLKVLEVATGIDITLSEANWPTILKLMPNFVGGPTGLVVEDIYRLQFANKREIILPRDEIAKQEELFYKLYLDKIDITIRPGLREWISYLRDICQLPIAMGTTTAKKEAEFIIKKSQLNTIFAPSQIVFGKNRDIEGKPKPDIYLATAERMGIDPMYQLVMGDSFTSDAPAAATAGSVFVATPTVDTLKIRKKFYNEGAVAVYPDWLDVNIFGFQEYLRTTQKYDQRSTTLNDFLLPREDDIFQKND